MHVNNNFLYEPRHFRTIPIWKNVTEKQWNNPLWQLRNSIRTVEQLEKVINLNEYQKKEIDRTLRSLKRQGKEPLRITPYYATLMPADPFHPDLLPGEKPSTRLDPVFWQSVPTPANLLFPDTGAEGAMSEDSRSFGAAYQRYPNRLALFVASNTSCASYCVHCQRAKSLDETADVNINEIKRGFSI